MKKPIVVVLGSGAIGCYYGARLVQTEKYHVFFYMRSSYSSSNISSSITAYSNSSSSNDKSSSSYSYCKTHGLQISSIHGDFYIPPNTLHVYDSAQAMLEAIRQVRQQETLNQNDNLVPDESSHSASSSSIQIDWILLGFKSSILDPQDPADVGLYPFIQPFLSSTTRVVAIMNGFVDTALILCIEQHQQPNDEMNDDESRGGAAATITSTTKPGILLPVVYHPYLLSLTKCMAVYAGMAFICCNRITPGLIQHTYGGKLVTSLSGILANDIIDSTTTLSSSSAAATTEVQRMEKDIQIHKEAIQSLFSYTTSYFEMSYSDNLIYSRWMKNIWNLSFNSITVVMGGITTDCIIQDVGLRQLVYNIMRETCLIANQDLISRGYSSSEWYLGEKEVESFGNNCGYCTNNVNDDSHCTFSFSFFDKKNINVKRLNI